jgi:hypothetical protein
MFVLNIVTRMLVVVIGVLVLLSVPPFTGLSSPLQEVFGAVVVLFGLFRMMLFVSSQRRKDSKVDV